MNRGAMSSKNMGIQKSQREKSRVRSSQEVIDEAFKEIQTKDARTSIMTWLYAERKMVFFFLVHLVATMLVYQHFFLKKFREKQDATPAAANRYNWKVYVPSLEFGAMHAILFQMALLPLTMCRYAITRLSDTWLKNIIPFNRIVDMHIHLGYTMVIIVFLSVFGFFSFFGLMCEEQKVGIEPLVNGERSFCDKFTAEIMATGYGILGALLIIGATSYFRHQIPYELFYLVHHLVFAMFAITIAHTVDVDQRRGIVERSQTFKWFVAPLIIYFTDRFFMRSTMQPMKIESSESIGTEDTAKAVILSLRKPMNFGFQAGQYAFLNFTEIDYTWHPFSIAADPGEEVLSFYIEVSENKTSWTYKLWEMGMLNPSHKMRTKTVNVLGPYGSKYDMSSASHLLMIGAGTGIVPMLSALKVAVRNFVQLDAKMFFHHDTFKNTRANELASNHKQLSRSLSNMAMRGGSKLGDSLSNLSGHGSGHGSAHGRGSGRGGGGGGSAHGNNGSTRWSGTSNISNATNASNGSISASSAARGKGTFDRIAAQNDKEKDEDSSSSSMVMATIAGEECKDQNLDHLDRNGDEGEDEGLHLIVGPASVADSEIYGCSSFTAATTTTTTAARAGDLDVEEAGFRAAGEGGEEGVDDVEDVELSRERVAARVHRLHIRETMRLFLLLVPVSEIVFAGLVLSWHAERWNMDRYYMAKTLEVGSIINVALFGFVWLCSFDAMFFAYWIDVTFIAVSILALVYWHNQFGTFDDVRIMAYVGLSAYRVMRGWMMSHLTLQDDVRALISKAGVDTVANVVSFRLVWINRDAKRVEFLWPLLDGIYSTLESKWGSEYAARALQIEVYVTDSDPQALASLKQSILGTNLYSVIVHNQALAAKGSGRTTRRSNLILHFGRPNIPELVKDQVSRRFPKIGSSPLLSPGAAVGAIAPPGSAVSSRPGVGADGTRSGNISGGGLLAKAVQNAGSASDSVSPTEWEEWHGESETSSTLVAFCGSPALGGIVAAGVIDMQIVAYATKNRLHTVDFYQENYGIAKDKTRKYKAGDGLDVDGEVQMVSKQLK